MFTFITFIKSQQVLWLLFGVEKNVENVDIGFQHLGPQEI